MLTPDAAVDLPEEPRRSGRWLAANAALTVVAVAVGFVVAARLPPWVVPVLIALAVVVGAGVVVVRRRRSPGP